ncbi:hypothetical protein EMIT0P265_20033 [Pseudomonas zeae]
MSLGFNRYTEVSHSRAGSLPP